VMIEQMVAIRSLLVALLEVQSSNTLRTVPTSFRDSATSVGISLPGMAGDEYQLGQ
jgi:hypothetical protein